MISEYRTWTFPTLRLIICVIGAFLLAGPLMGLWYGVTGHLPSSNAKTLFLIASVVLCTRLAVGRMRLEITGMGLSVQEYPGLALSLFTGRRDSFVMWSDVTKIEMWERSSHGRVTQSATIHASEGRSFHIDQRFREKKSPLSFAAFIDQVREKVPPGRS